MSVLDKYIYHFNEFANHDNEQISNIISSNILSVESINLNKIDELKNNFLSLKNNTEKEDDLIFIDQIIYILSRITDYNFIVINSKVGVESLPYGLDDILKINPIIYREMTPTGVIKNHEGNKISGFDNSSLATIFQGVELTNDAIIGALINAIKELKEEITQLKKQESRVIVISK